MFIKTAQYCLLIYLIFLFVNILFAENINWEKFTNEEIVNAIYLAEGGSKATYLYGIKSIKYEDEADARQICLNSVRNGRARWEKAGRPLDLITYIGLRYCPPTAHPLNSNWVRNVKAILERNKR